MEELNFLKFIKSYPGDSIKLILLKNRYNRIVTILHRDLVNSSTLAEDKRQELHKELTELYEQIQKCKS